MQYNSIVPSEMTNNELRAICADIQTAKNWNRKTATVSLSNGQQYEVDVNRWADYNEAHKTETNS